MQEDRRAEYTALRAEILQSDRTCLLMMGYLLAAVGFLYANELEWLVSFFSFIGLCYFTEKRFSIRQISSYIADTISQDNSGFGWDKKVPELRKEGKLRPLVLFRPYNVEAITCFVVALSPLFKWLNDSYSKLGELNIKPTDWFYLESQDFFDLEPKYCFWLIFALLTLVLSTYNLIKFNSKNKTSIKHPSRYVWDFWYYYEPGTKLFHVFYLNADKNLVPSGNHHYAARVGYATTYDFIRINWGNFDILQPPANHWANTSIWSGDIIKIKNGYLLFYTSRDKNQDDGMTQNIGVAYSKDLSSQSWQIFTTRIQPQFPYQTKSVLEDFTTHAWRDPFLFREKGQVLMLLSAKSTDDPIGNNGLVGLLRIEENKFVRFLRKEKWEMIIALSLFIKSGLYRLVSLLLQDYQKEKWEWEYLSPLVKPSCYSEMEVPQLYKNCLGIYELVFSTWAKNDFSPTTRKAGGLQGLTIPISCNFNNPETVSLELNQCFHVLMPEKHGLYACRIIPELGGEIVGFDINEGGIRRSGVKIKFQSVNRDFSDLNSLAGIPIRRS